MILDDIKNHLVQNGLVVADSIKFDYDSTKGEDTVLLHLYDNAPNDIALRSAVRITVKFADLKLCRDTCFAMYELFFPEDCFQKALKVNGKTMHTRLNKGPSYLQKDSSNRHNYVLDITFTHNR